MADSRYDDLSTQGQHRGNAEGLESGMNVRAPKPPDLRQEPSPAAAGAAYQVLYNEDKGMYRVHPWAEAGDVEEGFREVGRYRSVEESLRDLPGDDHFVVFENTATGEVRLDRTRNVRDNLSDDGDYDRITLFTEETEAAAYAERHQSSRAGRSGEAEGGPSGAGR